MSGMKALWLKQPWPTLIAIGIKKWETRGAPPNGPMRPFGVRGMPGLAIEPGERIAIVASLAKPAEGTEVGAFTVEAWRDMPIERCLQGPFDPGRGYRPFYGLPLGEVVCTVVVAEALPIMEDADDLADEPALIEAAPNGSKLVLYAEGDSDGTDISDQIPYGDWAPGRWAWRLTDVAQVEPGHLPQVTRGNRQGVCEIEVTW